MAVDMTQVWQAASDLVDGHAAANARLALWAAALSPRNDLANNGKQVQNLRPYANGGLPQDVAAVRSIIGSNGARLCTTVQATAVLKIDVLARSGGLDWVTVMPSTVAGWLAWRVRVAHLYGLSWKTASFAALLMWPFDCPLVPIDTHVCQRFGLADQADKISDRSKPSYRRYRAIERRVYNEWRDAGKPVPVDLWHWFKWDQQRGSAAVESHTLLSPYLY